MLSVLLIIRQLRSYALTTNWRIGQSLSVLSLLMAGVLPAVADDMRVDWQGFIAQGLIQAPDSSFVNFDGDMSAELTELGLSSSVQLAPAWRVAAQIVYLNGGNRYPPGLRLDYLFIDWNFFSSLDWQANVYLGRFKNQHWLFSATRDVPFTRPSIVLPQSIYFDAFRDISVATDGIAFQARNAGQYGDITINWSYGSTAISDEQSQLLLGRSTQGDMNLDFSHQASVFWQPVMSRFSFGLSLLDSDFNYTSAQNEPLSPADFTVQRVMLSARYQAELWDLTLEMQQERVKIEGFFAPQFYQNQFGQGGYLLLQYRPAANWRLYSWLDY